MNLLGAEAAAAQPPSRQIIVTGAPASGKTTLIRQVKMVLDSTDEDADRKKYMREVHKTAIGAFQFVLRALPESFQDNLVVSQTLALRRRDLLTAELAAKLELLFTDAMALDALNSLPNPAVQLTCRYFIRRLAALGQPDFIPSTQDLLYLAIPTAGRMMTRIQGAPGGSLSVMEVTIDDLESCLESQKVCS